MKIEHVLFPCVLSRLRVCVSERYFYCVHMIRFSKQMKIGSCEQAVRQRPILMLLVPLSFYFQPFDICSALQRILFILIL